MLHVEKFIVNFIVLFAENATMNVAPLTNRGYVCLVFMLAVIIVMNVDVVNIVLIVNVHANMMNLRFKLISVRKKPCRFLHFLFQNANDWETLTFRYRYSNVSRTLRTTCTSSQTDLNRFIYHSRSQLMRFVSSFVSFVFAIIYHPKII